MVNNKPTILDTTSIENRYIFHCDAHDQRRMYNVCVKIIDAHRAGRIQAEDIYGDCANAIQRGRCTALPMRKEEIDKNKAIYFLSREDSQASSVKKIDKSSVSYKSGWNKVAGTKTKDKPVERPVSKPPAKPEPTGDYAAAINNHIAAKEVAQKTNKPVVTATQGKSMLELALEMSEE